MTMIQRVSLRGPLALFVVAATVVTAASRTAHADDAALSACIAANEGSIQGLSQHKLLEAREQALKCAVDACPAILRDACGRRIQQVNAALPTIVFDAKDSTGADVAVTVTMDGHPVNAMQGATIPADPGEHKFVFEAPGQPPVEKTFILREGEKDRHEPIVIGSTSAPTPGTVGPGSTPPAPPPVSPDSGSATTGWSTQKTLALVAGGVGVAGVAVGAVFGLMAHSSWSNSQNECPSSSNCPQHAQAVSDHNSATTFATVSTIGFAAGAAVLAGGALLWFTAPHTEPAKGATTGRLRVVPGAAPGSAGMLVTGEF
jgi:hypothetical protein